MNIYKYIYGVPQQGGARPAAGSGTAAHAPAAPVLILSCYSSLSLSLSLCIIITICIIIIIWFLNPIEFISSWYHHIRRHVMSCTITCCTSAWSLPTTEAADTFGNIIERQFIMPDINEWNVLLSFLYILFFLKFWESSFMSASSSSANAHPCHPCLFMAGLLCWLYRFGQIHWVVLVHWFVY